MKSISAKCGHIKRRLAQDEPLEGKVLEFALDLIEGSDHELLNGIAEKLKVGEKLDEYEYHTFVEVFLLHVRLGASDS